jgi:rod shape-determining protein MreD
MLMVMLFWVLCQPTWCGVWFAFVWVFLPIYCLMHLWFKCAEFCRDYFWARYFIRERRVSLLEFMDYCDSCDFGLVIFVWVTQVMAGINYPVMRHWQPLISSVLLGLCLLLFKKWRV